ncbi:aspartyl aminopeptidase [Salix suchowensis]|nr:aspartyl aminopeptidase [Salix suchowensis]
MLYPNAPEAASRFLKFVNASPTPFHAILEKDNWDGIVEAGGKYYFTRWYGAGLSIVATHVDSPNLRRTKSDYLQVGVETYGGGIWHSWFDRDLSIAGRVVVSDKSGTYSSKLIKIERPILRIPTLAIHCENSAADFKFNTETEFTPILASIEHSDYHHPVLLSLLAGELSVAPEEIHDFELQLYDTQPSVLGGINNEFIFSPEWTILFLRMCSSLEALADHASTQSFPTLEGNVNCIALFNHEEIGSVSTSGSISRSFLISSDMGHALHPNYTSKHEDNHKPQMNAGIVIKTNAKQRYASDAIGSFLVRKLVERKGGKVQEYEVRNDMACGSTVGPMLSALGLRTVDVGNPMLSMHSIRETAGAHDVQHAIDLFEAFFQGFAELDQKLTVE